MTVWQFWHGFIAIHGIHCDRTVNTYLRNRTDCRNPDELSARPPTFHVYHNRHQK